MNEPQTKMTTTTHLTGLEACDLHRRTPYGMTNVSATQLSIARHFGSCRFNGESYTYIPTTDELIRDDVLRWKMRQKKEGVASQTPA